MAGGLPSMSALCRLAAADGAHLILGRLYRVAAKLTVWRSRLARRLGDCPGRAVAASRAERQLGTSSASKARWCPTAAARATTVAGCRWSRPAATHLVGHHKRPWLGRLLAAGVIKMVRDGGVKGGKVHLCMALSLPVTVGPAVAPCHAQTHPQSEISFCKPRLPATTGHAGTL